MLFGLSVYVVACVCPTSPPPKTLDSFFCPPYCVCVFDKVGGAKDPSSPAERWVKSRFSFCPTKSIVLKYNVKNSIFGPKLWSQKKLAELIFSPIKGPKKRDIKKCWWRNERNTRAQRTPSTRRQRYGAWCARHRTCRFWSDVGEICCIFGMDSKKSE